LGNIYCAGYFQIGSYSYVVHWNGVSWSTAGAGTNALNANSAIYSIAVDSKNNLYAGGDFTDGAGYSYVAEYGSDNLSIPLPASGSPLQIYPNPANRYICVSRQNGKAVTPYCIIDGLGSTVCAGTMGSYARIDISMLGNGTYFFELNNDAATIVKFIKE
jgi:hypothetical protein